jgi:4-hydroxy-tetrahydrodipicolinate reductase
MSAATAPLSLALVGYGTMGREIERLAPQYGCAVQQVFRSERPLANAGEGAWNFDVAIDFSLPALVKDNAHALAARGKHIVVGTTGWTNHADELRQMVELAKIGMVWGANFSVGVQMFCRLVRAAAELANKYDDYDLALHELHHRRKLDSPSGTALALAAIVGQVVERKTSVLADTAHGKIPEAALHLSSTRVGDVPGTHTLYIDSAADTLELTHRARNRSGFAIGALRAAQWIRDKHGWYDFADIFDAL